MFQRHWMMTLRKQLYSPVSFCRAGPTPSTPSEGFGGLGGPSLNAAPTPLGFPLSSKLACNQPTPPHELLHVDIHVFLWADVFKAKRTAVRLPTWMAACRFCSSSSSRACSALAETASGLVTRAQLKPEEVGCTAAAGATTSAGCDVPGNRPDSSMLKFDEASSSLPSAQESLHFVPMHTISKNLLMAYRRKSSSVLMEGHLSSRKAGLGRGSGARRTPCQAVE